jgi:hypothetical protein
MRVSQVFALGGGHGHGGGCDYGPYRGCGEPYYTSEDFYRWGGYCYGDHCWDCYRNHGCEHDYHGGLLIF